MMLLYPFYYHRPIIRLFLPWWSFAVHQSEQFTTTHNPGSSYTHEESWSIFLSFLSLSLVIQSYLTSNLSTESFPNGRCVGCIKTSLFLSEPTRGFPSHGEFPFVHLLSLHLSVLHTGWINTNIIKLNNLTAFVPFDEFFLQFWCFPLSSPSIIVSECCD